jgi:hypothetical protein
VIVEWNAHLFSRDQQCYPFHPQADYLPDASQLEDDPLAVYLALETDPESAIVLSLVLLVVSIGTLLLLRDRWLMRT